MFIWYIQVTSTHPFGDIWNECVVAKNELDDDSTFPSESCWMVPGTVDPNE